MSYDLAVWQGKRPRSDSIARTVFEELFERAEVPVEPTPVIHAFVASMLDRYPDMSVDASGKFVHLAVEQERANEVVLFVAATAAERGLVCFDPQARVLLD